MNFYLDKQKTETTQTQYETWRIYHLESGSMAIATPMNVLVFHVAPYKSPPFGSGEPRHLLSLRHYHFRNQDLGGPQMPELKQHFPPQKVDKAPSFVLENVSCTVAPRLLSFSGFWLGLQGRPMKYLQLYRRYILHMCHGCQVVAISHRIHVWYICLHLP